MPLQFSNVVLKKFETFISCIVLVYLYNVYIEKTLENLFDKLSQIFKMLAIARFKYIAFKCSVFTQKVHYLWHIVV